MGARDVTGFQTCALPLSVIDASVVNAPLDSDNLLVGFWLGGGSYFVGAMDELRVYNRVLSAADISTLYTIAAPARSEKHASELQSLHDVVSRLVLAKRLLG